MDQASNSFCGGVNCVFHEVWGSSVSPGPPPFCWLWNWPRGSTIPGREEGLGASQIHCSHSFCFLVQRDLIRLSCAIYMCEYIYKVSWAFEHIHNKNTYILSLIRSNLKGNKSIQRFAHVMLIHPSNEMEMSWIDSWKTNSKTTKTSSEINKKWQLFSGQLPTATGRAQRAPRTVHAWRHNREGLVAIAQGNAVAETSKARERRQPHLRDKRSSHRLLGTAPSQRLCAAPRQAERGGHIKGTAGIVADLCGPTGSGTK